MHRANLKRIFVFGLAMLMVLALGQTSIAQNPASKGKIYKWRMADHWVRGTAAFKKLDYLVKFLKEASGGQLDIQHFGAKEIVASSKELWNATSGGQVEMSCSLGGYHMNIDPTLAFDSYIPFAYKSPYEMNAIMYEWGVADLLVKIHAKYNVYPLFTSPAYGSPWMPLTKFPIRKASDLKGRKVRAFGIAAEVLRELGAAVVFLPLGEVYVALERGIVDGVFDGPLAFACQHGFHEVTKYTFRPGVYGGNQASLYVNLKAWNSLPKSLQDIIEMGWRQFYVMPSPDPTTEYKPKSWGGSGYDYIDEDVVVKMVKNKFKFTITDFPDTERAKIFPYVLKVFDKYSKKSADFAAVADRYRKFWKYMGYID